MVDGIIFDMDGVLVDSERQSNEGWKWAAKKQGIDMPMWPSIVLKEHPMSLTVKYLMIILKEKLIIGRQKCFAQSIFTR